MDSIILALGMAPQCAQRLTQEARVVALCLTVEVVFWKGRSAKGTLRETEATREPRTIVVERVEPFGGRSEVIRVFFIPVISVLDGGPNELLQGEGEVDMKR